jgi:sugar lactone lactonase YvrE
MHSVELVVPLKCEIGESPLWHSESRVLFFLDIPAGIVFKFEPSLQACQVFARTRVTGGFTLQQDGSLLLFQDGTIALLRMDGTLREVATNICPTNERFNDAIADPEGRVFAGTMGGNGRLLRFDPDGAVHEMLDGLAIPNGMGFTPDLRGMYFTDSVRRTIYCFDYDRRTGDLNNRRIFAEIPSDEGLPDGMTVDAEGYVWTAIWFGGRVKRYAPNGCLEREIFVPAQQVSAVAFGGPELRDIYITTAATTSADALRPVECDSSAHRGGGLYRTRLSGIQGRTPFRSRLAYT